MMSSKKNNAKNLYGKDEEHSIRTLARYYPLNEETNTFEIGLRYEKASDLFDENSDSLDMAPRLFRRKRYCTSSSSSPA